MNGKGGAHVGLAFYGDRSPMEFHQTFGQCQPQAGAFMLSRKITVHLEKLCKQHGLFIGGDANAGVGNIANNPLLIRCLVDIDLDGAGGAVKFDGIAEQVQDNLAKSRGIHINLLQAGFDMKT